MIIFSKCQDKDYYKSYKYSDYSIHFVIHDSKKGRLNKKACLI